MRSWKTTVPWIVLALVALAAGLGISRITFDVDVLAMLPDSAEARGLSVFQNHFGKRQGLLLTIACENSETSEKLADEIATALEEHEDLVSKVVWRDPLEEEGAAADLVAFAWLNTDPNAVSAMARNLAPGRSAETLQKTLQSIEDAAFVDENVMAAGYDPFGLLNVSGLDWDSRRYSQSFAISSDGKFRLLSVLPSGAYTDGNYRGFTNWLKAIHEIVLPLGDKSSIDARLGFTGEPVFLAEIGSGMEHDMKISPLVTTVFVGLLFFSMFRCCRPLFVLLFLVALSATTALGFGGLYFGSLSVMSAGFAAIVIGLVIDYGVVLWCDSRMNGMEVLNSARQSVLWSALTTAAVFLSFNLSSYPGVAELGTLVAAGVVFGVFIMFASPLNRKNPSNNTVQTQIGNALPITAPPRRVVLAATGVLSLSALAILTGMGKPTFDSQSKPFQLRDSPATFALDEIQRRLWTSQSNDIHPFVVWGRTNAFKEDKESAEQALQNTSGGSGSQSPQIPFALAPDFDNQRTVLPSLRKIIDALPRLETELLAAGFTEEAGALLRNCASVWKSAETRIIHTGRVYHPRNEGALWIWQNFYSERDNQWCLAGTAPNLEKTITDLEDHSGMGPAHWDKVAAKIQGRLNKDLVRVGGLSLFVLCAALFFAYRRFSELALSLAAIALSALLLAALTRLLDISWTGFSLFSLPILLGTGIDYAFHMIFALRSDPNNFVSAVRRMQKALVFCAGSSTIAFGSLALSKIQGLAALGTVCALGILVNLGVMAWLLPAWWRLLHKKPT